MDAYKKAVKEIMDELITNIYRHKKEVRNNPKLKNHSLPKKKQ